jgi:hypothetical protein
MPYEIEPASKELFSRARIMGLVADVDIVILDALLESFIRTSYEACRQFSN